MGDFFLGRLSHWIALIAISAILWFIGAERLHVTGFNWFALIVLALSVAALSLVVLGYRPGDRVMRDPLDDPLDDHLDDQPSD